MDVAQTAKGSGRLGMHATAGSLNKHFDWLCL